MQLLKQWRGEGSKKRNAEESIQESSRKRTKNDDGKLESSGIAMATGTGNGSDQEYKIRGNSTTNRDLKNPSSPIPKQSASSPLAVETLLSSSSVHPDRRANIITTAPTSAPASASPQIEMDAPLSPLSPSTERINKIDDEEHRPIPLNPISQPNLRIDTVRSGSSMDPRSPDYTPIMSSNSNKMSHDSPIHDPRRPLVDNSRYDSNPPSRRKSDIMPPPQSVASVTRSKALSPETTSPPANNEFERRQPSTTQPQLHLHDSLNAFAQSIMSAASLTVRRDLAKQQAVGQQRERDRQFKLKSTFLTLSEDAESRLEGFEKVSSGIEKQIDLNFQAQSKNALTLAAQLLKQAQVSDALPSVHEKTRLKDELSIQEADLKTAEKEVDICRDLDRFNDDIAETKAGLKAAEKEIGYLKSEAVTAGELRNKVRGLATKDELRGIVGRDELRRFTTDEVRKHVTEALVPTEKKLASLTVEDSNLNQKLKGVEEFTHKHRETTEGKDQEHFSRFGSLEASLKTLQMEHSRSELTMHEQKEGYAAIKVDLDAQSKVLTDLNNHVRLDPSNGLPSLDTLVARISDQIQSLQQDFEKLNEELRQLQDLQAASKIESPPQVSKASINVDAKLEDEVKLLRSGFDALKAEQKDLRLIQDDLDAFKADQEKVVLIRTDLDSLISEEKLKDAGVAQGFEAIEQSLNNQQEALARLQTEIRVVKQSQASRTVSNHPPTPPPASASTSPWGSDKQKLQDVEMGLRNLTKTTQALELVVNTQQQKFDGMTSDRVVQSMVHQMQQMYPQHPGPFIAWQVKVDSYLSGNLKDRLVNIESQIAARDSKVQEITQIVTESRQNCITMKQALEELRDVVFYNHPQGPSEHGNRIDELGDRMMTVEAKYVKAIDEFQTNLMDLIRNVTQLQLRNGTGSTRNTPGMLTITSRDSKSIEPNGSAAIFKEDGNGSDSSDTPLVQRAERGVRRDREGRPPSHPNLKRKEAESDDEDEDEGEEAGYMISKKIPKRRNVSGSSSFS